MTLKNPETDRPGPSRRCEESESLSKEIEIEEEEEEEEEAELEKLELKVKQMAQKILEARATLPEQLSSTLSSLLTTQRPVLPTLNSQCSNPGGGGGGWTEAEGEVAEKVRLVKEKILSNASAMGVVVKRLRECVSKTDKLHSSSSNGNIHPAFKRRKTS